MRKNRKRERVTLTKGVARRCGRWCAAEGVRGCPRCCGGCRVAVAAWICSHGAAGSLLRAVVRRSARGGGLVLSRCCSAMAVGEGIPGCCCVAGSLLPGGRPGPWLEEELRRWRGLLLEENSACCCSLLLLMRPADLKDQQGIRPTGLLVLGCSAKAKGRAACW